MPGGVDTLVAMTEVTVTLSVRDLTEADLPSCSWAGTRLHLTHVAAEVARARSGVGDYLAVCGPADVPLGIGGIDYRESPGAGTLWQLAVHPALRSCGIGTTLVRGAELRIRDRGLRRAELGVEDDNPRARALYERLGYVAYGREPDSWDEEGPNGDIRRYETMCTLLRKEL